MCHFKPVVVNKKTRDLYFYNGENNFTNIRTDIGGKVTDEAARKTFAINSEAGIMLNEYPQIVNLIKKLGLRIEQNAD